MPTMPTATFSGMKSMMRKDPFEDHEMTESDGTLNGSTIQVTQSFDARSSHRSHSIHQVSNFTSSYRVKNLNIP